MATTFALSTARHMETAGVVVTGSATASGMPWSQLLTQYPFQKARSTNLTTVYFELDLTAAASVFGLWLGYTNFRPGQTQWRVRAATSQANLTAAPDYDSTTVYALANSSYDATTYATDWPRGTHAFLYAGSGAWSSLFSKRWVRVDLTDATHPDGYFQAGRLLALDQGWAPSRYFAFGSERAGEEGAPDHARSVDGHLFVNESPVVGGGEYNFPKLGATDANALRTLFRNRRFSREVFVVDVDGTATCEHTLVHGYFSSFNRPKQAGWVNGAPFYSTGFGVAAAA